MKLASNWLQSKYRVILFYFAAIIVVLSPLAILEIILQLCISPPAIKLEDPYISFKGIRSLFVLNHSGKRFKTAEERLEFFCPQSFAAVKKPDTFRIFCLGGSTVQGRPYSVETSFTTWLGLNLKAAQPDKEWEVINCGGISYASYRLVPLMREFLQYKPDLFIIYTGHNEFLEDRTYQKIKQIPRPIIHLHEFLLNLRSYSLAYQYLSSYQNLEANSEYSSKTILPTEVNALLDMHDGLESYHRNEAWRQGTIAHFRHNLTTLIKLSRHADVPVILANPVSNLKDTPPFKAEFKIDLPQSHKEHVIALWEKAEKLDWNHVQDKIKLLEQAAEFDHGHAGFLYLLGKCYEQIGQYTKAKKWFIQAKDEDVCPLRILEPMHQAILDIADQYHIPLVDVRRLIKERTKDGIPGNEWLLDHVHPNIKGHQLIADSLHKAMEEKGFVYTPDHWKAKRNDLRKQHLASINEAYYEHGAQTLKRLQEWSRGRIPNSPSKTVQ